MLKVNNIVLKYTDKWLFPKESINWNPYNLPPYTLRVELLPDAVEPLINYDFRNDKLTMTQVSVFPNIWDITYIDSDWDEMFEVGYPGSNIKGVIGGNLTGVTSIQRWFHSNEVLEYVNLIDTPDIVYMGDAFNYCTNLEYMPKFNAESVEDMYRSFGSNYSLVHAPEFVNSSNLRNLYKAFVECTSLTDIPLFDTSNVTNFEDMFYYCPNLKDVPNLNTSSAESLIGMFGECISIEVAPELDTSNVVDMSAMFEACTGLKDVPLYNTSAVTSVAGMFAHCYSLETVPLFDTSNVTAFSQMFYKCANLKEVPLFDVSSATHCAYMFEDTVNVESGSLALYNRFQALGGQITSKADCFKNCGINTTTGAAELAQIPYSWK